MKMFTMSAAAGFAIAAAAVFSAGTADAVPSGMGSADQTLADLKASGYHVIVNKLGAGTLDSCTVTSVRPGQTFERMDSGAPGAMDDITTTVISKTVYVDVAC